MLLNKSYHPHGVLNELHSRRARTRMVPRNWEAMGQGRQPGENRREKGCAFVIVPVLAISVRRVYRILWIALSALLACDWFLSKKERSSRKRMYQAHGALWGSGSSVFRKLLYRRGTLLQPKRHLAHSLLRQKHSDMLSITGAR